MVMFLLVATLALRPVVVSAQITTTPANNPMALDLTFTSPGSNWLSPPVNGSSSTIFHSVQKESPEPFALVPGYIKANVCFYPRAEFTFSSKFSSFSPLHPLVLRI
jgi:hypothetical protein